MTEFRIKTLRCEFQVVSQEVDQYGMCDPTLERVIHSVWPTYEEAIADLKNHGVRHTHTGRWIPKNRKHSYVILDVQYREVEVK